MKGINLNKKNGAWKGNNVGLRALHAWIKRRLSQPERCERCNKKFKKLDLANISQKYHRRLDDWEWLCRSCHMDSDGRKNNLLKGHNGRPLKNCEICNALTNRVKFCEVCAKQRRIEWWRKYNQTAKRKEYQKKRRARMKREKNPA